ncbi:hypothetical protein CspHIS471_0102500 [Cutaneotrichosporon sp. HIS471]|nr:hypothetical protein CspHIS471_0102500 [Cutaneotrichosporon sp. HIS471]
MNEENSKIIGSAWAATATLLLTIAFEAAVVKLYYGSLKKVGHFSQPGLAEWKANATAASELELEPQT